MSRHRVVRRQFPEVVPIIETIMQNIKDTMQRAMFAGRRSAARLACGGILVLLIGPSLFASDHADPLDFTRMKPLEPVITDLFVFPVDKEGKVVAPFKGDDIPLHPGQLVKREALSDKDKQSIKGLMLILCVRRALTQAKSLKLEPYTYKIHIDTSSAISYDD